MMSLNDEFEAKIKSNLDTQVQGLDADTRHQLVVARRKALNQPSKYSWRDSGLSSTWLKSAWLKSAWLKNYGLPAGSLALCSLLAVFILVNPKPIIAPANVATNPAIQLNDQAAALELLDNVDDIDTTTDPDFYLWADEILATEGKAHAA